METTTNTEKKKQKVSVSYTLKSLGNNITKLLNAKMISKEEAKIMNEIKKKAVTKYIEESF